MPAKPERHAKPEKHVVYVPQGYENNTLVLQALAEMRARFGAENVTLEVERARAEPDTDEGPGDEGEGTVRRVLRLPPDEDC